MEPASLGAESLNITTFSPTNVFVKWDFTTFKQDAETVIKIKFITVFKKPVFPNVH